MNLDMVAKETKKEAYVLEMENTFPESVTSNVSLKNWTTFHCTSHADLLFQPRNINELKEGLKILSSQGLNWRIIGRGSNLLVRDGGVREVLIALGSDFSKIEPLERNGDVQFIRVGAGVTNGTLMSFCRKNGLKGFGFSYGIPGTIGGGVRMNAGTPLGWFSQITKMVKVLNEKNHVVHVPLENEDFSYRDFPMGINWIVLEAVFKFHVSDPHAIDVEIESAKLRRANQPLHLPNFGSVFKNPSGDHAGRLIEAAGLKGLQEGAAQISSMHANFIVNHGNAKTKDVLTLMNTAKKAVKEKFGVMLEEEVHVIGEDQ